MMDWTTLDITLGGLAGHYQRGDFTPRQLVQELLAMDAEDNNRVWIHRLSMDELEPYLARLESATAARLPLYGVPFAIKDNIDLAGIDTTAGCEAYRYRPEAHATVVARLIEVGAIPMGKTNLDQFATGLVGVRSPYGACRNAFNPAYISGGSSSGSAVATALGLVSFALGTDTAGSGRVPAALNNLIGLKPTRGIISCRGVVPACRSLDCVSIFALTVDDAHEVLAVAEGFDPGDAFSRANPFDNGPRRYGRYQGSARLGIPRTQDLEFFGDIEAEHLFREAIATLGKDGHELIEVDISPLLESARLLYEGPWVTERYLAIESLIESRPEALLPVIDEIIGKGRHFSSADTFRAAYRLQGFRVLADELFATIDALVTPTAPTAYTIESVQSDPVRLNSRLGTYTNFMNLLDLSAVAIPAGFLSSGVGFGITLQAPAFNDRRLLALANSIRANRGARLGATSIASSDSRFETSAPSPFVDLVVCGAHLEGMPLNWQLTERGAVKQCATSTTPDYRLYAMADGRPALFLDEQGGAAIEVEIWRLDKTAFGSFVTDVPAPLGIGKVRLADGRWLTSFIAEPRARDGATEITRFGGWRAYRESLGQN